MNEVDSIVLLGCKHCGKSTHGRQLAEHYNVPFFDTDAVLEKLVKMPFREYYKKSGPAAFMLAEEEACKQIMENNPDDRIVVATGGGICDNAPALNRLRPLGKFVFLELDLEFSIDRIERKIEWDPYEGEWKNCPAYISNLNPKTKEDIHKILFDKYTERFAQYRNIADITVHLKNQSLEDNFNLILQTL